MGYPMPMELPSIIAPNLVRNPFAANFSYLMKSRREARRTSREGDVYLFSTTGIIGRANIVDESAHGLRLSGFKPECFEGLRYVLLMHSGVAHQVELVWDHDGHAGFSIRRLHMRGPALDSGMEDLRAIWRRRRV